MYWLYIVILINAADKWTYLQIVQHDGNILRQVEITDLKHQGVAQYGGATHTVDLNHNSIRITSKQWNH